MLSPDFCFHAFGVFLGQSFTLLLFGFRQYNNYTHFCAVIIVCPPLPAITNGMISYSPDVTSDYDLGTKATYTCEAGFYFEGNEVRTCMDDDGMDAIGMWSGQEPNCVRKSLALYKPVDL